MAKRESVIGIVLLLGLCAACAGCASEPLWEDIEAGPPKLRELYKTIDELRLNHPDAQGGIYYAGFVGVVSDHASYMALLPKDTKPPGGWYEIYYSAPYLERATNAFVVEVAYQEDGKADVNLHSYRWQDGRWVDFVESYLAEKGMRDKWQRVTERARRNDAGPSRELPSTRPDSEP